jgi:primosomal protein N' (replication factor Y)
LITEVTSEKPLGRLKPNHQIVVATPGSIPASLNAFAGVLILDCDIWLSRESLRSEELAIRDWTDALASLHPNGRAVAAGMPEKIGKTIALGQYVAWAQENLSELRALQLPPVVRTVSFEGTREVVESAVSELLRLGATSIRFTENQSSSLALMKFPYKIGPQVGNALRDVSLKASPRATNAGNRRGLRVVMDDGRAL